MRRNGGPECSYPPTEWYNPAVQDNTWLQALKKTRQTTLGRIAQLLGSTEINDNFWVELETVLIQADVGLATTQRLLDYLQLTVRERGFTRGEQVQMALAEHLRAELGRASLPVASSGPSVTVLVGVNGSGKTTSAAKLALELQQQGNTVLLAAADTYRAAATEQLRVWAERLAIEVISGNAGSDPGAIVYDACQSALAHHFDHLIVDTSGRMHTEHNLMSELQKLCRVCNKVIEGAPHAVLLVLDATTGQNGLAQALAFTEAVPINGTILAKLDGSAKGGIVLAIRQALNLPVLYVGVGETLEDFAAFDPDAYVHSLLSTN
ncbi:MAG: signal recognition particle-docking protein FtsY [Anaerolineales bacterium]|nr:MAG: signal recognition particle-docking protein FtsY [Anaerolineales bacterium]